MDELPEETTVSLFETDILSDSIESAFKNLAAEKSLNLEACTDIALSSLPDTVLLKIFSNFSHPELCRIALVCKHWLWVVYDSELWKFLDLSKCRKVEDKHIISLIQARLSPLLRTLDLSNCNFSPIVFNELTDNCQQLDTLVLQNCDLKISDEEQELNVLSIPENLIRLDIRSFKGGFRFMHVILEAQDMSKLECFGFGSNQFCPSFNDFQIVFNKMHSLKLLECVDCDSVNDAQVHVIADQLALLESLVLKKCKNVNGSSLSQLISKCLNLKSLNLSGTGVHDVTLTNVDWALCTLEELDLSFCDHITSDGLVDSITKIKPLQYLALNNVGKGKAISGEVLEAAHKEENWKNLEIFSLHLSARLFDQALSFLELSSNLSRLSLRTCHHISFKCIAENMHNFPNLTGIECGSLFTSDDGSQNGQWMDLLTSIGSNCKKMKDIALVKCLGLPISKVTGYQYQILNTFEKCGKLENLALLYTEEAIFHLIENCAKLCSRSKNIKVGTNVWFTIIPTFRHSLDSEINKQKFKKYFGY